MFACFSATSNVKQDEEATRAHEENAWLRRMLEREQEARAAAEQALASERLRNALLEREVLAAAQAAQEMGDSLCMYLSTGREGISIPALADAAQLPQPGASPGNWSVYSTKPMLRASAADDASSTPPAGARDQRRCWGSESTLPFATQQQPLPSEEPDLPQNGGGQGAGARSARLHRQIVEMSTRLKGFASEWVQRLEAMETKSTEGVPVGGSRPQSGQQQQQQSEQQQSEQPEADKAPPSSADEPSVWCGADSGALVVHAGAERGGPSTVDQFERLSASKADAAGQEAQHSAGADSNTGRSGGGAAQQLEEQEQQQEENDCIAACYEHDISPSPIAGAGRGTADVWRSFEGDLRASGCGSRCGACDLDGDPDGPHWCDAEPVLAGPLRSASGPLSAARPRLPSKRMGASGPAPFPSHHDRRAGGAGAAAQAQAQQRASQGSGEGAQGDAGAGAAPAGLRDSMTSPLIQGRQSWASLRASADRKQW